MEIGSNLNELQEFIQVFGQRYIGLVDNINLYQTWRVPQPLAPYPQDYIIDQNGIVRYWSDEYDPKEIIKVIDRLLAASIEETTQFIIPNNIKLIISPNPAKSEVTIKVGQGFSLAASVIKIYNSGGRLIDVIKLNSRNSVIWDKKVPNGVYFIQVESNGQNITKTFILIR